MPRGNRAYASSLQIITIFVDANNNNNNMLQAYASPLKRQRPTPLLSVFACLILLFLWGA